MDSESIGSFESLSRHIKDFSISQNSINTYAAPSEMIYGAEAGISKELVSLHHHSINDSILNEKLDEVLNIYRKKTTSDSLLIIREAGQMIGEILKWYFGISHVSLNDITPDISDAENVFVSAEGLLINLYYSFGFEIDPNSSPQTLPYFFLFERFMNYLIEAGTKRIVLIFVDDLVCVLEKINSGLPLLRESLIIHSRINPDVFTIYNFSSWLSEEFRNFLREVEPSIFLVEDGSSISNLEILQTNPDNKTINEVSNEDSDSFSDDDTELSDEVDISTHLLSFALEMLSHSNIALFYKMERKGQRITAFTYSSTLEPRFTEISKGIMRQNALLKFGDEKRLSSELNDDLEPSATPINYLPNLKDHEYNLVNDLFNKEDHFYVLLVKAFIRNSISVDDMELSSKDENISHNILLIVLFSKMLLLSGYLRLNKLSFLDRQYISNSMMEFKNSLNAQFTPSEDEEFGWEFDTSILKSLEYLQISEFTKQLRSITNEFEKISPNISGDLLSYGICDLCDPVLMEFLFYTLGYASVMRKGSNEPSFTDLIGIDVPDKNELERLWSQVSLSENEKLFPISLSTSLNKYIDCENDRKILSLFGEVVLNRKTLTVENPSDPDEFTLLPINSKFVVRIMSELGVGISGNGQIDGTQVLPDDESNSQKDYLNQVIRISGIRDVASWEIDRPQETRPNSRQEYSGGKEGSSVKLSIDLEKKRQLRDNQRKQQFWFNLGQILTGNDKLQQTIVVNPFHVWNKLSDKNAEKEKGLPVASKSSKAEEIIRKNEEAKLAKMRQDDENQMRNYENKLSLILSKGDPDAFMLAVYDMLIGIPRKTNEFGRFRGLSKSFKLPKSRSKILVRTLQTCISILRSFKISTLPEVSHMVKARSALCMTFRLAIEIFNQYYLYLDKSDLLEIAKILINLGFLNSASNLVENYKKKMESDIIRISGKPGSSIEDFKNKGSKIKKPQSGKKNSQKEKKDTSDSFEFPEDTHYSDYQNVYSHAKKQLEELSQQYKSGKSDTISLSVQKDTEASFQLRYMGADFERSTGSVSDPRVPFSPDYWQKEILDIIDSGDSALVCAPTASGKTFICYYAMEQVLRFDNESVVVFIAPTKALADQVHAEIAYRFGSKTYPNHSRISLLCKLSRDYSINIPTQCQILITLPFMLELLLMSTSYQQWVSRIKFVIFDEVHCINEAEGGVYWERIFQLIPCPYLCLSATIGNPLAFYNWLQRIGKLPASKVHFVAYSERYADLSTIVYEEGNLYPLNPLSCLSFDRVLCYGLPGDFYLPPNDALDLYLSLKESLKHQEEVTKEYISWLNPQFFFLGTHAITKRQYRFYLSTLLAITVVLVQKKILTKEMWMEVTNNLLLNPNIGFQRKMIEKSEKSDVNLHNLIMGVENIKDLLSSTGNSTGNHLYSESLACSISQTRNAVIAPSRPTSPYKSSESFLKLVRTLQQENMLPCIIFNMERSVVEHLGKSLIGHLTKDHHDKYYGSEEAANATKAINKRRQEQYAKEIQRRDMLLKLKTMSRQQREKQGIVIDESELQALENLQEPGDISEEYDPEFYFCDRKVMGGREREIQDTLYSCEGRISPIFIEGLRRGIGIHHDGLSLRYRRAVETLYRIGYLCIIISTRTLALGVNMPCRTTVFVNDSISLTPLLYRQASGRAGRRGYDIQGSVVFWDISVGKRNRLLTAELPTIKGNFPVTPTTVLRTFMLFESVLNEQARQNISKERAIITFKALVKFYRDSLYSVDYNHDFHRKLTATQFRFIVDLLRRFHVLDKYCACTGYAGIVSHMFEFEGTNLLLSKLIHSGAIFRYLFNEDYLDPATNNNSSNEMANLLSKDPIQRLLLLLAHIYLTKPMTRNSIYNIKRQIEKSSLTNLKQKISSGRIQHLLLSLPDYIQHEIDEFNHDILSNMRSSLSVTCSNINYDDYEYSLPLSNTKALVKNSQLCKDSILSAKSEGSDSINNKSCIQSPFISLLGLEDVKLKTSQQLIFGSRVKLNCTHDLLTMVKTDEVTIEKENVSLIIVLLNSFLVDFYESQRFSEVIKNNSIASSEIFFLISEFKVLLDRFLYSFNLLEIHQYQNLNVELSRKSLEFHKNISKLTEILQITYDNYRTIAKTKCRFGRRCPSRTRTSHLRDRDLIQRTIQLNWEVEESPHLNTLQALIATLPKLEKKNSNTYLKGMLVNTKGKVDSLQ
ncbi:DEAD/DEAH box helicase domain-containing protein [Cryptosporidium felis]|nr:DEAD/DEAH box helicase domain-containing protein [Cryptosporidium felis]